MIVLTQAERLQVAVSELSDSRIAAHAYAWKAIIFNRSWISFLSNAVLGQCSEPMMFGLDAERPLADADPQNIFESADLLHTKS